MNPINHPLDLYVLAVSENRIEDAKIHLLNALRDANMQNSQSMKSGIAQRLADLLLKQGDALSAKILYCISEDIDPNSMLAKYEHAKFLLGEMSDSHAAIEKCDEILKIARGQPFLETADDFSSDQYIDAVNRLRLSAIAAKSGT